MKKNYILSIHSKSAYEVKLTHFNEEFSEAKLIERVNQDEEALLDELMFGECWDGDVFQAFGLMAVDVDNYMIVVQDEDGNTQKYDSSAISSEMVKVISSNTAWWGYDELSKGCAGSIYLELDDAEFDITKLTAKITSYGFKEGEEDTERVYTNRIVDHFTYENYEYLGSDILEISTEGMNLIPIRRNVLINKGNKGSK
jgi:hypothetical protein